jgi:hypothetical protein
MKTNKEAVLCGANIRLFYVDSNGEKQVSNETVHPQVMTWNELYNNRPNWFINHPTFCFRKYEILSVGAYNETDNRIKTIHEDFDLMSRVLKHYGKTYTLPDILLLYRLHPNQLTYKLDSHTPEYIALRNEIVERAAKE